MQNCISLRRIKGVQSGAGPKGNPSTHYGAVNLSAPISAYLSKKLE